MNPQHQQVYDAKQFRTWREKLITNLFEQDSSSIGKPNTLSISQLSDNHSNNSNRDTKNCCKRKSPTKLNETFSSPLHLPTKKIDSTSLTSKSTLHIQSSSQPEPFHSIRTHLNDYTIPIFDKSERARHEYIMENMTKFIVTSDQNDHQKVIERTHKLSEISRRKREQKLAHVLDLSLRSGQKWAIQKTQPKAKPPTPVKFEPVDPDDMRAIEESYKKTKHLKPNQFEKVRSRRTFSSIPTLTTFRELTVVHPGEE